MSDQAILATTLVILMGLLIWGKWRYDAVTLICLAALVLLGIVPANDAFSGFGHPAVVTVALVLLISRGLQEAGMVSLAGNLISRYTLSENQYLVVIMVIAAFLSSFMNNIGAMALLLPITLSVCQKMDWNPSKFLMPLAFASILGGMNTVIGTPPNIIIAQYRQEYTGAAFNFFDYSFVGLAVSVVGILFIALIGYRFVTVRENDEDTTRLIDLKNYLFEVKVRDDSNAIGMRLSEIKKISGPETEVLGVVNETGGVSRVSMAKKIQPGQVLVIKTSPDDIASIQERLGFEIAENLNTIQESDLAEIEVMVTAGSRLIGRKHEFLKRLASDDLALLGLWRRGAKFRTRLAKEAFKVGDVLLLGVRTIDDEGVKERIKHLGLMPLMERDLQTIPSRSRLLKSLIFFTAAIALTAFNVMNIVVAFLLCVIAFISIKVLNGNLYRNIEWPVVVMLAAMIPVGQALETSGISLNIANFISTTTHGMDLPWLILMILVITMFVSDIVNNAATAVIMAPIAANLALQVGQPVEPFLMAVAVGASCAFLSPIGHQCNTLVMAPGNYKFGDYWRLGLPLECVIVAISIPMILFVWT
ncbi:SLC13 family permease [Gammaproteobacteria bacterium]|jgi:di/tricarboxylate transporter|nr:SLC13 family permease [Gammaproteobacteria bacterium]MDA9259435.1 SLC13 family permease [Gammaproteobacteria bacterium]MDA9332291.1 SLC13 family permease [Gammaproteobacteria bacterium]MDA9927441.1 SLC13 family permease [Gammaproteobacteria bacterium]MDB9830465.1 SLC13 family permease [Gammaproteobacteria bacterium]